MNPFENAFQRGLGGSIVSIDPESLFRPEHLACGESAAEATGPTQALRFGKVCLAAAQCLFSFFAIVDIRRQVVPTDNATLGIALRTRSQVEPTVHAVGSTPARFKFKRLPS